MAALLTTSSLDAGADAPGSGTDAFAALPVRERVLLAAMECVGQWGVSKTTVDDVARRAGCGRATVYRLFPAGKTELFRAAAQANISRMLHVLATRLEAPTNLRDLLIEGVHGSASLIAENPAAQYMLTNEPHVAAPHLSFQRLELLLATVRAALGPSVARFCDRDTADRLVELGARIVVSYTVLPDPDHDLTDRTTATRVVDRQILAPLAPLIEPLDDP